MAIDIETLKLLLGKQQQDTADTINSIQALGNLGTKRRMDEHADRMGRVQDAYWKAKCPDYEAPSESGGDDEMGNTYLNCTIQSDSAIKAIAGALDESPAPAERPRKPWWRWLLGTLAAVLLGALIVYLTADNFLGDPVSYDMVALPYEP